MIEIVHGVNVERLGGYRLRLRFSDGTEGERDFSDMIAEGGEMVEPLRDPLSFSRVFIERGVLAWPNGFDLDSIALHIEMREHGVGLPCGGDGPGFRKSSSGLRKTAMRRLRKTAMPTATKDRNADGT